MKSSTLIGLLLSLLLFCHCTNDDDNNINRPPTLTQRSFEINESSSIGTILGTIEFEDPDGDQVVLSIISGNEDRKFELDQFSGELSLLALVDFEEKTSYVLFVRADDGRDQTEQNYTIDVLNSTADDCDDSHLAVFISQIIDEACGNNGNASASSSGGIGTVSYSIDGVNFQSSGSFDLPQGSYTLTAKDESECTATTTFEIGLEPDLEIKSIEINDASGCSSADGSIEIDMNGGTETYRYSIDGGNTFQNSNFFDGLAAGSYEIIVQDARSCMVSETIDVETESKISIDEISTTESDCLTGTGVISITASGGTPPYTYELDSESSQSLSMFNGIEAGEYVISVVDSEGCEAEMNQTVLANTSLDMDIFPILDMNCNIAGCHNGSLGSTRDWTDKTNVISSASAIMTRTQSGSMPPATSGLELTQDEIDLIACWVNSGARDN